ncbi:hypothetical protein MBLNU459_g1253t1 [Dothideomycetes sp. NU459]
MSSAKLKTNLELLNDCNQIPPNQSSNYKFMILGYNNAFGTMLESVIKACDWDAKHWRVDPTARTLTLLGSDLASRNQIVHDTLTRERERGSLTLLHNWTNEVVPVYGEGEVVVGCHCPEVQFVYEMRVPADVVPVPGDGEVEEITLLSVARAREALAKGEFTPANGCVILDFFIRHGLITYENEPDYIEIASRLHRVLDFQTA